MNPTKHLAICAALVIAACTNSAPELTIPQPVLNAFAERFPNAQGVKWEEEEDKMLEATFVQNGSEHSANFTVEGVWKETEQMVPEKELPEAVRAIVGARHPGATVSKAERVSTPESDLFEVELATDSGKVELMLTAEGLVVPDQGEQEK